MPPDRLEVEHVVEGRDRLDLGRRQLQGVRDLAQGLGRQPAAVLVLGHPQRRQDCRAPVRIVRQNRVELQGQRSTSPMTVSSEPTIAIRSAIQASAMQVAVACSATNDGARNLTRHGRGPPSETT